MTDNGYSEGILDRWRRAVLHIECAPNREAIDAREQAMQEALQERREGKIDEEELSVRISSIGRRQNRRATGTALYLKDGDHRFLVTARRVVETASQAHSYLRNHIQGSERLRDRQGPLHSSVEREITKARKKVDRRVAGAIARVATLDDVYNDRLQPGAGATTLSGLNKVDYEAGPFSFGEKTGLAVISLRDQEMFVRRIEELGHLPVAREDVADGPSRAGSPLFTVGYPFPMSLVDRHHQHSEQPSMIFGEPTFSFGRTSMKNDRLNYFWADLNMYPGNSGGPVVEQGKLVGIVSGRVSSPVEATASTKDAPSDRRHDMPFERIVLARHLQSLLDEQIAKHSS